MKGLTVSKAVTALTLAGLALLPLYSHLSGNIFIMTLFTRIIILALAAASLNLIMGYGGMMSFGHAAYLGIGGYAVGILAFYGVTNGWLQLAVAIGASALIAAAIGAVSIRTSGVYYPAYRLSIIAVALLVAALLYVVVMRTRIGMLIRAGASNREMIGALGINIKLLFTLVFGLGAALAGLAGLMQAPILTVQIGMGENILILAFVVIIIGGIGSIRGAFVAAIIVGLIDTIGRAFLPDLARNFLSYSAGSSLGPALSSMMIYMLMAAVLVFRPEGLFPAASK